MRIYFAAATAAADRAAQQNLETWLKQTHYEDRTLDALRTADDSASGRFAKR